MPTSIADPGTPVNGGHGKSKRLPRGSRLIKHDVLALLRHGARFVRAEFEIKLGENRASRGRIAIAVPKRILKFAVHRNQVKRLVREEFRQNSLRISSVDFLVTLRGVPDAVPGERMMRKRQRQQLRGTLGQLFGDVSRRLGVVA